MKQKYWTDTQASSEKDDWETPQDLFDELHKKHNFTLDAAATERNTKLPNYYTVEDNALTQKWEGRVFCNPPYGREIKHWVKKAYEESLKPYNEKVIMLIPSRTDTSYWHEYVFGKAKDIDFLRGRLKFEVSGKSGQPAPFPSAIITYELEREAE
ncbi:DNA N-6-adenine-methyltransferase [Jeotgalibaca porci]|uniref:DNA N-6-adenine-methyltransferase n=1 Tax=Jeotgalibaca porci TaxID=1868793 RepID=UPI0035A015F6